jgi:hypothetical protein
MNQLVPLNGITTPTLVVTAGERASVRFLEFFASSLRNRLCRNKAVYAAGHETNDVNDEAEPESSCGARAQAPALPARRDPDVRTLVCCLSAEPASH